jgi:hypothetical protein
MVIAKEETGMRTGRTPTKPLSLSLSLSKMEVVSPEIGSACQSCKWECLIIAINPDGSKVEIKVKGHRGSGLGKKRITIKKRAGGKPNRGRGRGSLT